LSVALNGWYQLDVSVASTNAVLAAESPLPSLSPATRRLGKGLWALPAAPEAMSTGPDLRLAYDRFEEVVRWLMAQPQGQKVGIFVFTEGAIAVPPVVAARAERLFDPGAQRLPGIEPGESYVAGFRAGRPLLLKRSADGNEVVTAEDQLDWLRTQIDQL
jgi:hypothetical protein